MAATTPLKQVRFAVKNVFHSPPSTPPATRAPSFSFAAASAMAAAGSTPTSASGAYHTGRAVPQALQLHPHYHPAVAHYPQVPSSAPSTHTAFQPLGLPLGGAYPAPPMLLAAPGSAGTPAGAVRPTKSLLRPALHSATHANGFVSPMSATFASPGFSGMTTPTRSSLASSTSAATTPPSALKSALAPPRTPTSALATTPTLTSASASASHSHPIQPHLLLSHQPLSYDMRDPPSSITYKHYPLSHTTLSEPATTPPLPYISLKCVYLPKSIKVYTSNGAYVSLADVFASVYATLRTGLDEAGFYAIGSSKDQKRTVKAYERRYRRFGGEDERRAGLRQVDLLLEHVEFAGLSKGRSLKPDEWYLHVR